MTFFAQVVGELVLPVQAVQFGELQRGVVMVEERLPVATSGQQLQPAQLELASLGQVAMLGEEFADLRIARLVQPGLQLGMRQVRLQRVVLQGLGVPAIGTGITLGQGAFGLVIEISLLGECVGAGGACRTKGEGQAGNQVEQGAMHGTPERHECEMTRA